MGYSALFLAAYPRGFASETHVLAAAASEMAPLCEGWFCQTYPQFQGLNPSHLVIMMIPFWISLFLVNKWAVQPLRRVLEEREARTEGARAEAADFESKFKDRLAAWESRLAETRAIAKEERQRIRKDQAAEEERILGTARDEAAKIVDEVRAAIDAERVRVRGELKKQAEALARELATAALGREIKGDGGARSSAAPPRAGATS